MLSCPIHRGKACFTPLPRRGDAMRRALRTLARRRQACHRMPWGNGVRGEQKWVTLQWQNTDKELKKSITGFVFWLKKNKTQQNWISSKFPANVSTSNVFYPIKYQSWDHHWKTEIWAQKLDALAAAWADGACSEEPTQATRMWSCVCVELLFIYKYRYASYIYI